MYIINDNTQIEAYYIYTYLFNSFLHQVLYCYSRIPHKTFDFQ